MKNNGLLYNKVPEAYMTVSVTNTEFKRTQISDQRLNSKRSVLFNGNDQYSYFFKKMEFRIVNIGKWHVVYQRRSRHGDWGPEQTAKIVHKNKKVYFEVKNRKFYLKKANIVF